MLIFITGFIASMAHVVTGPDHLAAVTPLAIDSRKKSWIIGFSWGLGHTIGMLLIGGLFILFKEFLPVEAISKHSETVIGFLLFCAFIFAINTGTGHILISTTSLFYMLILISIFTIIPLWRHKIMVTSINRTAL